MSYSIRKLSQPTAAEFEAANKVLASAFARDEFTLMTIGRDPSLIDEFVKCVVVAGSMEGQIYVAEDEAATAIVGVAVWFGPGTEFCHSEAQQEKALRPLLEHFDPELQQWWNDPFLPTYNEMIEQALGQGKLLGSWHLQLIGVDPKHQRQGIATEMINFVRKKAHSEGYALVLEPTNDIKRQVYERMGFVTKGHRVFKGAKDYGEVPMWSMIDEAPTKQA